ncbi:pentatricopeptide repeat-containing protein At2g13600 [Cryptomeria japonica]|uniref:pentatricopeptide repeat-containing protein At2g13600 n=1 Tax=Cryptomeria japonica TaxID=3369 RepID=UPI0027DA5292|nr:pentatricopeptide repeat-containing protein At2g13600 [Cryptomeria japonica]
MRKTVSILLQQHRLKNHLHGGNSRIRFKLKEDMEWVKEANYHSLFRQCKSLTHTKLLHSHIILTGFKLPVSTESLLVSLYAKWDSLDDARRVFDKMPKRTVVSWTVIISGYVRQGMSKEALVFFNRMRLEGMQPNEFTFATVLPACAHLGFLQYGKRLHQDVVRCGFASDVFVTSALVDMYCKCGNMKNARLVFDQMPQRNVVSWNALIGGCLYNGYVDEALRMFRDMPEHNVVSWSAIIGGYVQHGFFEKALEMFREMQATGLKANPVTFASLLPACANLAALNQGKEVHQEIIRSGFQRNAFVESALVDMYAKCGSLEEGYKVFKKIHKQELVSWNAMIFGYAMHGCVEDALKFFNQMLQSGTKPDSITFIAVLSACCHVGLVHDGWKYFHSMNQTYQITPGLEHYSCMVDILGRAGHLDEAHELILKVPGKPDPTLWVSLLGACRLHANVELGECIAKHLFEMDPAHSAHYVLLSNIYAVAGRWEDRENVRKLMKTKSIKRMTGCSWIEVNNKVHTFRAGNGKA